MALKIHPAVPTSAPDSTAEKEKLPDSAISALGLIVVTVILLSFGLTMLYSASFMTSGLSDFTKQLIYVCVGLSAGAVAFSMGYQRLSKICSLILYVCWILLIITLFCRATNGAQRWIRIPCPGVGELSLQPSELAKIALCLWVANYCTHFSRSFNRFKSWYGIWPLAIHTGITCGLVALGQDLGTTVLIISASGLIMMAAGLYFRWFIVGAALALSGATIYVLNNAERFSRVVSIFDPAKDAQGSGYQLYRGLMALGSGGWFGQGIGTSRMKTRLPEQHTDFILAVVGEELGLVGILFVLLLYVLWGYFAVRIAFGSRNKLGLLLGFGIAMAIQLQAFINLAVVSGSAPTKGMPAAFISYGGSNILGSLIGVSLLLSVAMENINPNYSDKFWANVKKRLKIGQ